MFREGYYLEIIKTKNSAATAVITVKEKTVELKSKKKTTTNKWLTLEDWASLYELLEKALLHKSTSASEKIKRTRHLEVSYTFEPSENPADRTSLPTIRVGVSPLKKKSKSKRDDALNLDVFLCDNNSKVEEYVPDGRSEAKIGYVPSRKSTLEYLQQGENDNEYVPSVINDDGASAALYVPNSVPKAAANVEIYEPSSISNKTSRDIYIPNSKGLRKKIDEYQPDFTSKSMKFDDSYVPSSSKRIKELKKNDRLKSLREAARGGKAGKKEIQKRSRDDGATESNTSNAAAAAGRKNSTMGQDIKREM